MSNKSVYGVLQDGTQIDKFLLENASGCKAEVTNYGALLIRLMVNDKNGQLKDVVLGCDKMEDYFDNGCCLGATVGRNANRIAGGTFSINGNRYTLAANDGPNNLHSGPDMYYNRVWQVKEADQNTVTFMLESTDGDQGFPGTLKIEVTYTLTDDNSLKIHYHGVCDKDTMINMTNHSFFNLNGHNAGTILDHEVKLPGGYVTRTDKELIPDGTLIDVKGTPLDFTEFKTIGRDIRCDYEPLRFGHGYDQNWEVKDYDGTLRLAAVLRSFESGITMEVYTDLPGIQMYTGNFLDVKNGKDGAVYGRNDGVALETQYYPDAIHHQAFLCPVFQAGESYDTTTIYKFV